MDTIKIIKMLQDIHNTTDFEEATHTYSYKNKPLPSVSQVILPYLSRGLKFIDPETLERARHKGNILHKALEICVAAIIKNDNDPKLMWDKAWMSDIDLLAWLPTSFDFDIVPQEQITVAFDTAKRIFDDLIMLGYKPVAVEQRVHDLEAELAGTIDNVFYRESDRSFLLTDYKSGTPKLVSNHTQLGCYKGMLVKLLKQKGLTRFTIHTLPIYLREGKEGEKTNV